MLLETERKSADLSQRLLDLMVQKYSLRQATILELKQAQNSFEESGYRLVNLEFAAKAAEIELRRLGGKMCDERPIFNRFRGCAELQADLSKGIVGFCFEQHAGRERAWDCGTRNGNWRLNWYAILTGWMGPISA